MKRRWWIIGLAIALLVAILSPLASGHPDGLERVAEDEGFIGSALEPVYELIPDYLFPGVGNEAISTILAGIVGTAILFGLMLAVGRVLVSRRQAS